jgi:recombination protein RecR
MLVDDPIKHLVEQFAKLPGIGERTALRLVLHMLSSKRDAMPTLAAALVEAAERVHECFCCHMLTALNNLCSACLSTSRDRSVVCVVATIQDLMALESTNDYKGLYHVLHGTLAPMEGIGPRELRIASFLSRLNDSNHEIKEVIIATPPNVEGEATALYLAGQVSALKIDVTRIASGVPVGGDLQFADRLTLSRALHLRQRF